MRILVDGHEGERVDPLDRGLQYGDGLFETIAVLESRPRSSTGTWNGWKTVLAGSASRHRKPRCCAARLAWSAWAHALSSS